MDWGKPGGGASDVSGALGRYDHEREVRLLTARGVSLNEGRRSSMAINRDKWIFGKRSSSLLAPGGGKLPWALCSLGLNTFELDKEPTSAASRSRSR